MTPEEINKYLEENLPSNRRIRMNKLRSTLYHLFIGNSSISQTIEIGNGYNIIFHKDSEPGSTPSEDSVIQGFVTDINSDTWWIQGVYSGTGDLDKYESYKAFINRRKF